MLTILPVHIVAGTLSVLTGAATLMLRKGDKAHRKAGAVFVVSMTTMAVSAAALGGDVGNAIAGGLTIYMVITGWMAARRRDNQVGWFEIAACGLALACGAVIGLSTALAAPTGQVANPYIVPMSYFLSGMIILAALGDLSVVLRRGLSGPQRVARHLWRMCFGLFIAVGSFAAQGAQALPPVLNGAVLLFSSLIVVLLVMFYWLARVLFTGWPNRAPAPEAAA